MKGVVEIVWDSGKGKLRAQFRGGWVRFPNHLRIDGAKYECELKEGRSGSWIVLGHPVRVNSQQLEAKARVKTKRAVRVAKKKTEKPFDFMEELKKIA